jgi:uncharacterized membrane protein YcaP (DUF421 family)
MGSIVRGMIVYLLLLLIIRITSRRAASPTTPFELIIIFLVGGAMIQAVVSDDRSLTNAITVVVTVAWMHRTVAILKSRFPRFGRVVDGAPVLLVDEGRWHEDRLKKHQMSRTDILAFARQRGIRRSGDIRYAVYERNGSVSIVQWKDGSRP